MSETDGGPSASNNPQDHEQPDKDDKEHDVDDLDMERRRLMARNRAKLIALGISVGVMELKDLAAKRTHPVARQRPSKPQHREPAEPTRRSSRLASGSGTGAGAETLLQLGEDGGAEVQGAEPRPRSSRLGTGEDTDAGLTEEEIAARAEQLRAREASRLRELELEGLVDFSPEAAVFVVIGSTGNHYTVRLSNERRGCQCVDHRIRKRDCKHIRLILEKLQIQDNPAQWHQAVERCFHAAAAGAAANSARLEALPAAAPASAGEVAAEAPEGGTEAGAEAVAPDAGTRAPSSKHKRGGAKRVRSEAAGALPPKPDRETRASRKRAAAADTEGG